MNDGTFLATTTLAFSDCLSIFLDPLSHLLGLASLSVMLTVHHYRVTSVSFYSPSRPFKVVTSKDYIPLYTLCPLGVLKEVSGTPAATLSCSLEYS